MKRLLLILVLIAVAFSGCTEKSPNLTDTKPNNIAALSIKSAESLSSYSLKSTMTQDLSLNAAGAAASPENLTKFTESAETAAFVDLAGLRARAEGSTSNRVKLPGKTENTSSTEAIVYQIGNSTYIKDEKETWSCLVDPRSAEDIWGKGNNNQVLAMAKTLNLSQVEDAGSETIGGEDAYKFKIVSGSADNENLYNVAFSIAAKFTQYPLFMPSINRTELNETGSMEKMIWISKKSYLPVKYQSSMSFQVTPEIIGGLDQKTGQMVMFNQSMRLGSISVKIDAVDLYSEFNKTEIITLPEGALKARIITTSLIQAT